MYNGTKNIKLKGIFTKEMFELLHIPFKEAKKHGEIYLIHNSFALYEVPKPYNDIMVFYTWFMDDSFGNDTFFPKYYFSQAHIEKYGLTPVNKDETSSIQCNWILSVDEDEKFVNRSEISFLYNRKNEEKYRLRFLTNPNFNPYIWEKSNNKK